MQRKPAHVFRTNLAILITSLGLFITALISYNRMQAYVEMHAFDGSGKDTLKK